MRNILLSVGGLLLFVWAIFTGYLISWRLQEQQRLINSFTEGCNAEMQNKFTEFQNGVVDFYKKNGFLEIQVDDKKIQLTEVK